MPGSTGEAGGWEGLQILLCFAFVIPIRYTEFQVRAMRIEEIRERYKGEWVLIEYTELDEELNVIEGEVIAHSPDREEIDRAMQRLPWKSVAIEYFGEIPEQEDLVVIL